MSDPLEKPENSQIQHGPENTPISGSIESMNLWHKTAG